MSRDEYTERFAFNVEWYDASAMLVRKYQLFYYPKEKLIEMVRHALPKHVGALQCRLRSSILRTGAHSSRSANIHRFSYQTFTLVRQ